jgi:hypothetical protein
MQHNACKLSLLIGLGILTSGCSVLHVDVDVYKGPLANQKQAQLDQLSAMSTGARPLLVQMRDTLQWDTFCSASDKNPAVVPVTGKRDRESEVTTERYENCIEYQANDAARQGWYPSEDKILDADASKPVKDLDQCLLSVRGVNSPQSQGRDDYSDCMRTFTDVQAVQVNAILDLYEDAKPFTSDDERIGTRTLQNSLDETDEPNEPAAKSGIFSKLNSPQISSPQNAKEFIGTLNIRELITTLDKSDADIDRARFYIADYAYYIGLAGLGRTLESPQTVSSYKDNPTFIDDLKKALTSGLEEEPGPFVKLIKILIENNEAILSKEAPIPNVDIQSSDGTTATLPPSYYANRQFGVARLDRGLDTVSRDYQCAAMIDSAIKSGKDNETTTTEDVLNTLEWTIQDRSPKNPSQKQEDIIGRDLRPKYPPFRERVLWLKVGFLLR